MERFSESEANPEEEDDDDDDDDIPLAVRALKRKEKGKAVVRDAEEDKGEGGESEQQQQYEQHDGSGRDVQAREAAAQRWSSTHRAMYAPFVYAPDIIAPSHPFGVYAPGTTPDSLGLLQTSLHSGGYEVDEDDLMPSETDDEALEAELAGEARLDAADARAASAYEATVWRELRGCQDDTGAGARLRRRKKRPALTDHHAVGDDAHYHALHLRKRRKDEQGGWAAPADMLKSPDGVRVKSAAVIEDSDDLDEEYLG